MPGQKPNSCPPLLGDPHRRTLLWPVPVMAAPPDQVWKHLWLQPEGPVVRVQPTDGGLRGHQGCDLAIGRKSDAGILHTVRGWGRWEQQHLETTCPTRLLVVLG